MATCADCDRALVADPSTPGLFACPNCGRQYLLTVDDDDHDTAAESSTPSDDPDAQRQDELSELRIRQLATLRRAAYRSRSHAVIAAVACAVVAVQLAMMAVREWRSAGASAWALLYVALVVPCGVGGGFFYRRAMRLNEEAKRSHLSDPEATPDFSTLGDGSDRWRNLEDVR